MLVGAKSFNVQNYSMLWLVWHYSSRTKALAWTISLVKFLTKYFNFWGFVPLVTKFRRSSEMAQMVQVPFVSHGSYSFTLISVLSLYEIRIFWWIWCFHTLHGCGLWWHLWGALSLLLHCKPVYSMGGGEYLFYLSWGVSRLWAMLSPVSAVPCPLIGKTFLKHGLGNFGKHLGWKCQTVVLLLLAPFIRKL